MSFNYFFSDTVSVETIFRGIISKYVSSNMAGFKPVWRNILFFILDKYSEELVHVFDTTLKGPWFDDCREYHG